MKKNQMLLGAAALVLLTAAAPAFADDKVDAAATPAAAPADSSEVDALIIIGQGQSRQIQTLNSARSACRRPARAR
jgi:iron complex outermembrane receptor protein